jgi:Helix-turn-helix domain
MPERKVYRFRIDSTAKQEAALSRYAGARRFVFNWALQRRKETYAQTGKSISWPALSVELTGLKSKPGLEWLKEIVRENWSLRIPQNGWTDETLAAFLSKIENLINSNSAKIEIANWRDELTA